MKNLLCYLGCHDYWLIAPTDGQVERGRCVGRDLSFSFRMRNRNDPLEQNWDRVCTAPGCGRISLRLDAYLAELERIDGVVADAKRRQLAVQEGKEG